MSNGNFKYLFSKMFHYKYLYKLFTKYDMSPTSHYLLFKKIFLRPFRIWRRSWSFKMTSSCISIYIIKKWWNINYCPPGQRGINIQTIIDTPFIIRWKHDSTNCKSKGGHKNKYTSGLVSDCELHGLFVAHKQPLLNFAMTLWHWSRWKISPRLCKLWKINSSRFYSRPVRNIFQHLYFQSWRSLADIYTGCQRNY